MKKVYAFFKQHHISTLHLLIIPLFYLLLSVFSLAQPEVLRRATNIITESATKNLRGLISFAAISALLFISVSYMKDIFVRKSKNSYEQTLARLLLEKLIHTKMCRLDKKQFGDISTVIIRNAEQYVETAVTTVAEGSNGYITLAVTFLYMCVIEWRLAACILFYNLVIRFFAVFVERKIKQNNLDVTEAMKESGNYLISLLKNMLAVRVYSNREFFGERLKNIETTVMRRNWKSFVWINGFQDFIWAFSKLAEFIIVYGVGAWLIITGKTQISILLTFVFANDLFTIGINSVAFHLQLRAEADGYLKSMEEFLQESEIEDEEAKAISADRFDIRFENVSFQYGNKQILKNVNFTIHKGEKVLLSGPNGQGKSTILKLMCGLYRPDAGNIYFGEQNINQINISELQKSYGYISQHSNILAGTVSQNIALDDVADERMTDETLSKLHILHCKETQPKSLSAGEKQRVNIGRSVYKGELPLLLCDEIFSNIDLENRNEILALFHEQYKKSTVIMIMHEGIDYHFDRVLIVEELKVSEGVV